jgi:hypothetical protein
VIFGIAMGFSIPNSLASAGAITVRYFSFNLAISFIVGTRSKIVDL